MNLNFAVILEGRINRLKNKLEAMNGITVEATIMLLCQKLERY